MKRRDFLKMGATLGVATTALPVLIGGSPVRVLGKSPLNSLLASATANDHILVIIQLAGGNDGLNCVIPLTDPLYAQYRPTLSVDALKSPHILADHDTLAFHPVMSGMATLYGEKKLAVLQNVGYANPNLSHFRGTDIWDTSTDANRFVSTGWIGRLLGELNPDFPPTTFSNNQDDKYYYPPAMQFGASLSVSFLSESGGMGIIINSLPDENNKSTHDYDAIPIPTPIPYQELDYVRTIEKETEVYTDRLINRSVTTNKVTYPTGSKLGQQLAGVAQCIASGFTTKIYLVMQGGYDTHSNQATDHPDLLQELSDCIKAFQDDVEAFGKADKVAGMTYSEFGRRPQENGSGTDHGTAAPLFVFGTQVIGKVHGNDPQLAQASLVNNNLAYEARHDFRNIYASVMFEWLLAGEDADKNSLIQSVLTSSNGATYSTNSDWLHLGIFNGQPSGVEDNGEFVYGLMLMENYPNPVREKTTIEYALPQATDVMLSIYTMAGKEVARIVDAKESAGIHRATFATGSLASGSYLYRLTTPMGAVTKQMIVMK
jgi:uncharacterized protein (DUF1501 family)